MQKTDSYWKEWLTRAEEDILWAENSFEGKFFNGVCFLSQQIVEKTLKAFLICKMQKLIKSHDLIMLCKECEKIETEFENFQTECEDISRYYIDTRYPDLYLEKPEEEAQVALNSAREIFEFVKKNIL